MSDELVSKNGHHLNKALSFAIDGGAITSNINDYYGVVNGIIPDINTFNGVEYRQQVGNVKLNDFNIKKSESLLGDYGDATEVLNGLNIYYPEGDSRLELISNLIAQGWQKDLNVFINTSSDTAENIATKIKQNEIKIGIIKVYSDNSEAVPSLNLLSEMGIAKKSTPQTAKELFKLEQELVSSGTLYPVLSIPSAISFTKDICDFVSSKDGKVVDFRFIKKS